MFKLTLENAWVQKINKNTKINIVIKRHELKLKRTKIKINITQARENRRFDV